MRASQMGTPTALRSSPPANRPALLLLLPPPNSFRSYPYNSSFNLQFLANYRPNPRLRLRIHNSSPRNLAPQLPSAETLSRVVATAATSVFLFLLLGASPAASGTPPLLPGAATSSSLKDAGSRTLTEVEGDESREVEKLEAEEMNSTFEAWRSKVFALPVPLRIVALRGSIPPSWPKDFIRSQGKSLKLRTEYVGSLENIFSDLSKPFEKKNFAVKPKSTVAADLVSVGDSWLGLAIKKGLIQPIDGAEHQDWFQSLSDEWKIYLRRNCEGEIDPKGEIWATPYRWGTMVIAYKKSTFKKRKLAPIEDWKDLWRPELAGRIAMVDSPREVVGAVLKYMGESYNTKNIDLQVAGGMSEVEKNLSVLRKQVRLFDSSHYLKAFGVGDVWVAVGWSSDVLPVAKRSSNVAVVVPKSGTSLWADLWAIPAASRLQTNRIGGRVRGPSPLIHQWIEFCLQSARALPFRQEVIPGAIPAALGTTPREVPEDLTKGQPTLDTNLIAGVPPPDVSSRCEFLEPLSDASLSDYKSLIDSTTNRDPSLVHRIQNHLGEVLRTVGPRPQ